MAVAIIAVTAFQGYWLRGNYQREKTNLELQANTTFKETVLRLQSRKFWVSAFPDDSLGEFNFDLNDKGVDVRIDKKDVLAGYLNDISVKVHDSLLQPGHLKKNVFISMRKPDTGYWKDVTREIEVTKQNINGNRIVKFLYSIDSLQDSLHVAEIDSAFSLAIKKKKIDIPYSILREELRNNPVAGTEPSIVRVGLVNPVGFQLKFGNTVPYILKQLTSPILFSFFIVGITLLSFLLLYRSLQKQRTLTKIKNEFISNITHELKTPISTVGVAIEALRNFNAINDPQRTKEYLDISQNELQRLSLLVDKVLKLSMFENKETDLKYELLDLENIVTEVISSMKLQIEKHQAKVSFEKKGDTTLRGDRLHLLSVVFNLLDNALKYGNGNIVIDIKLIGKEKELELSVADNGIGISPEYKDKVFDKFFRVPAGDTHNTKGYGLGLSYVAHVVEKHKGKIKVESPSAGEAGEKGTGTKFIISLPKQSA